MRRDPPQRLREGLGHAIARRADHRRRPRCSNPLEDFLRTAALDRGLRMYTCRGDIRSTTPRRGLADPWRPQQVTDRTLRLSAAWCGERPAGHERGGASRACPWSARRRHRHAQRAGNLCAIGRDPCCRDRSAGSRRCPLSSHRCQPGESELGRYYRLCPAKEPDRARRTHTPAARSAHASSSTDSQTPKSAKHSGPDSWTARGV